MRLPAPLANGVTRSVLRAGFKLPSTLPLPLPFMRRLLDAGALAFRPRRDVLVERVSLGGVPAERITPTAGERRVLLHFHGGAFFAGSARSHRALASELAARSGSQVYVLDYRRAPEHPYPAALDDGLAAWQALLDLGWQPAQIVLGGDSGGGALILALAIALRDRGQPLPAGLVMISPYLDLTLSLPSVTANAGRDPMTTAIALRRGGDAWRGGIAAGDPRVSPLHADLRGLPPVLVQAGEDEILLDDARVFAERALAAGVPTDLHIYPGMWHNFQMFNALIAPAEQALDEIGHFIRQH